MWRLSTLALALMVSHAAALELKNQRLAYGPFGPTRTGKQFLPGDILLLMYDIDGLEVDPTTQKVSYESEMEILDGNGKSIVTKKLPPHEVVLHLGGGRVPGDLHAFMGADQKPGFYTIKLTLKDRIAKKTTGLEYRFELLPDDFGMIQLAAPAFGVPGQPHPVTFTLANTPVDKKTKLPDLDITLTVFEEGSKKEAAKPIVMNLAKQLPEEFNPRSIPVSLSLFLNRPGRFVADLQVEERIKGKKLKVQLPFTVLEVK